MSDPTTPPTAQAGSTDEQPPVEEKRFTQAELDTLIKERLERQRRAMEAQQREAQAALETQKLEDQKEFEKLAKQRADEISTLKPRAAVAESYEKRGERLMALAAAEQSASVQMLLNKLPVTDQLDWMIENWETLRKPPPVTTGATDINAWSRTTSTGPQTMTEEEYRRRKRAESIYK